MQLLQRATMELGHMGNDRQPQSEDQQGGVALINIDGSCDRGPALAVVCGILEIGFVVVGIDGGAVGWTESSQEA